jgi:hypothetical protein
MLYNICSYHDMLYSNHDIQYDPDRALVADPKHAKPRNLDLLGCAPSCPDAET